MRIGIDFDNTIACYDRVFLSAAKSRCLVDPGFRGGKTEIRDAIRARADGERDWQALQGQVYGVLMSDAHLIDGVGGFLAEGRRRGIDIFIVSHKTQYGHFDENRVDLREQALAWMAEHRFFDESGYGLARENVHFASTRAEKVARIDALACTDFIDDLVEVFREPGFPAHVRKALYCPHDNPPDGEFDVFQSWEDLSVEFFNHPH